MEIMPRVRVKFGLELKTARTPKTKIAFIWVDVYWALLGRCHVRFRNISARSLEVLFSPTSSNFDSRRILKKFEDQKISLKKVEIIVADHISLISDVSSTQGHPVTLENPTRPRRIAGWQKTKSTMRLQYGVLTTQILSILSTPTHVINVSNKDFYAKKFDDFR